MPKNTQATDTPFDADTLKELRESARVYQKLDLAYVAAGGTIITALKISNGQLFEIAAQLWVLVYALVALLAIDTYVEQLIFADWIAEKSQATRRKSKKTINNLLHAQPMLHFLFISVTVVGVVGYSQGVTDQRNEYRALAVIQEATASYISEKHKAPDSIETLIAAQPIVEYWLNKMEGKKFRFEADDKEGYRITYAGRDEVFGTKDDEIITPKLRLQQVVGNLEAKEWQFTPVPEKKQ